MRLSRIALLLALSPFPALAAPPSLLGVTIGEKVALPDCQKGVSEHQNTAPLCLRYNDNHDAAIAMLSVPFTKRPPYIDDYYNNRIWFDGKMQAQSVDIDVIARYHQYTLKDLKAKFGEPSRKGVPYGSFGGVVADQRSEPIASTYEWDLPGAHLTYVPYSTSDGGLITLESPEGKKIREGFHPGGKEQIGL